MYLPSTKHGLRVPVVHFAGQEIAALQSRIFFPDEARVCASVPPPAPVPMMITS